MLGLFDKPSIHNPSPTMSARPQNIGIKAIEVYFPSQVGLFSPELLNSN